MDTAFAIKGKDFVLLVQDATVARSIFKLRQTEDKTITMDNNKLMSLSGTFADAKDFSNYVQKNIHLYRYQHGYELSTEETANWMRLTMAKALRKNPWQVNTILAGIDDGKPQVFWMDYMGTLSNMDYCAHGYAAYFLWGIFDNQYKKDCSLEEAKALAAMCLKELKARFIMGQNVFIYKVVTADGIRQEQVNN